MRKRSIYILLLFLILSQFMVGCSEHYKTDFLKKFDSYLSYSLGDFEVVDAETIKWRADPLPVRGSGLRWVLAFTDDRGFDREFTFKNYGYTQGGDQSNFGYAVMEYAMNLCEEQITTDVLLKYFHTDEIGLQEYRTNETKISVALINEYPPKGDDYYANFVDPQKGLQLKSIHPKQLINDWGASYNFLFHTLIDNDDQMKEFMAKIELVLRDYAKYVNNYDLLPIEVNGENYEDGYHGTYNKETDSFTWITKKDYLESLKYIDGNLKKIEKVIINGKEYLVNKTYKDENVYFFADSVTYSQTTKQYHINDFEDLLTLLGYKVSMPKEHVGPIIWSVGTDTYSVRKLNDWSLKKNGGTNLLKYSGHECGGISQSDFEMLSNTTVYMDKETWTLVVNSN
ncbi:hypothetical protein [Paenibacillus sp. FSL K6-2524]|uniref:hypothetical protein n=1 Tax=Paenibacillus sp. FSL K6-2524 TaxID=2954516 RepID=UPI0030FC80F0